MDNKLKLSVFQKKIIRYILKLPHKTYTLKDFPFGCKDALNFNLRALAVKEVLIRKTYRVKSITNPRIIRQYTLNKKLNLEVD